MKAWSLPDLTPGEVKKTILSVAGPLVALVFAYYAQAIFDSINAEGALHASVFINNISISGRLWWGCGVYLISILIWVFTVLPVDSISALIIPRDPSILQKTSYHPSRLFLLVASLSAYFVSILLFIRVGENSTIRGLWVLGLLCFIISQISWFGDRTAYYTQAEESPRFRLQNWVILGLILVVSFWLRFNQLTIVPNNLHGDMASYGLQARGFLLGPDKNIFGYGFYDIPIMGFLPTIFSMAVFGNNLFGLQMTAVMGGMFSLLAVYLLIWRLFNSHRLAALTTILVAINIAHIHFSRIAAYMDPWAFGYFSLFFLIDGLKARRTASFGLAGVLLGFSLQMYFSGRVLVFIIGLFFLYALFFQRKWIGENKRGLALMVIGILLAMGPGLVFHLTHWSNFNSRSSEVFLFSPEVLNHLLNKYHTDSPLVVLLVQIRLSLLMFNQSVDTSTQFGFPHPMFSSLISPLVLLGLGFAVRRLKDSGMIFILIWLGLITVLGSILTVDAPFWPRLVGILPAGAFLAALSIDQIVELGKKIFGTRASFVITCLMIIFLAAAGFLNWNQYYLEVKENDTPQVVIGRYISSLPADVTACSLLNTPPLVVRETDFLTWPHKLVDIKPDAPDSDLETCTGPSLVWVLSPENVGRLAAIQTRWPDGIVQTYTFSHTEYKLTFYVVGVEHPALVRDVLLTTTPLPRLVQLIIIAIALFISGMLVWEVIRRKGINISDIRHPIKKLHIPSVQINLKIPRLKFPATWNRVAMESGLADIFSGIKKWYVEVISFQVPRISPMVLGMFILTLISVGTVYFAQTFLDQKKPDGLHLSVKSFYLLSENQRLEIACIIFVVSALLWTFATIDREETPSRQQILEEKITEVNPTPGTQANDKKLAARPMQIASIFLTVSAMFIYSVVGENSLVRWLWIVAVVSFLVSLYIECQFNTRDMGEESPRFHWYHVLTLFLLTFLAFYLRVYHLSIIPLDLSTDMASVGVNVRDYLLGTEQRIFGTGWYYMPRLSFIPYIVSMTVIGNNLFGLYFATVIMGTLNVLGIYLFIWRLFDRHRLALMTAVIVTISPAHIHFSRITSFMDPWFLGFFGLFFFFDGLKGKRKISLALAGFIFGLVLVSYPAGRAIIPIVGIALVLARLYKSKWLTENYAGIAWMILGVLVALGPNLVYLITDWSIYMQRAREVIIFTPGNIEHLKYTFKVDTLQLIVWEQVKRSVLLFNYYTDNSAQFYYPHPMFNSFLSPLLILGFGMSLYRWKKLAFSFVLSSFVFILITGSILTINAPTWARLVGIIPLASFMIALVVDEFINILGWSSFKPFVPFLILAVALFLGLVAVMDWKTYLLEVENYARPVVRVARYLDTLPDEITVCGMTDDYGMDESEIVFLGWPHTILNIPAETPQLTSSVCPGENLVWILSPAYQNRVSELEAEWPDGIAEDHRLENGDLMFVSYLISKSITP